MRSIALLLGALTLAGSQARAQEQPAPTPRPSPGVIHYSTWSNDDNEDRAALGINTSSTGKRDTLGLLITSVTVNSPAEKAGLSEGDRIAAINGTSLKVAAADAGEQDMGGVMTRRLIRELRKVKAGDEVSLTVYAGGAQKTVKVKTVTMDDISPKREKTKYSDRAALGIGFGGGSMRDTLGLFVQNVTPNGPAEKAGIEEGNRIAAINGVDLRVPAAEAGEGSLVWAKQSRLSRVLNGLKPGDVVELRVYANGAWKTVKVTTVKVSDVFGAHDGNWSRYAEGMEGYAFSMPPMPPMAPMAPMPPMPPMPRIRVNMNDGETPDGSSMTCVTTPDQNTVCSKNQMRAAQRAMEGAARADRSANVAYAKAYGAGMGMGMGHSYDNGGSGEIVFGGLRLTRVSADLASYFGEGSQSGLLVLDADDEWAPVKTGDVLLTLNGKAVQRGSGENQRIALSLDTDQDNTFGILRKGKKLTITVKAH